MNTVDIVRVTIIIGINLVVLIGVKFSTLDPANIFIRILNIVCSHCVHGI